jgi:hypothetical protein
MSPPALRAQAFSLLGREVEVHGFASQGFVYTNTNNWLTMNSNQGSGAFTDFGINGSTNLTDRLRIEAQFHDRNLGQLGRYQPSLDFAAVDYRLKSWFGVRGGKVKTVRGLYNDSQDLDFLHIFALLPQSIYPADLRDSTIAHTGGDVYGNIALNHGLGGFSYTVYAGHRSDGPYSGYPYLLSQFGSVFKSYGGLQYGADLRWATPVKGLLAGISRMNQDITGKGVSPDPENPAAGLAPYSEHSKSDWTDQYYAEYRLGKLRVDSEYRRYIRDERIFEGESRNISDVRGWYFSGTYRLNKRLAVGSYYSRYTITSVWQGFLAAYVPNQTDTTLPANHIYDKVITARLDVKKFWDVKVEAHFMNGYGNSTYPDGFYPQVNPGGFRSDTNALVLKIGFNF